jgi:hypothetical protein
VQSIVTITDRRRQQLNCGAIHHGLASLKTETHPRALPERPHGRARRSCILELRSGGCRLISAVSLTGIGVWYLIRGCRRSLRPLLSRMQAVTIQRCRLRSCVVRTIRRRTVGNRVCDHHPLVTEENPIDVVFDLGGFPLAPGRGELASFAFATASYTWRRTRVIDTCDTGISSFLLFPTARFLIAVQNV